MVLRTRALSPSLSLPPSLHLPLPPSLFPFLSPSLSLQPTCTTNLADCTAPHGLRFSACPASCVGGRGRYAYAAEYLVPHRHIRIATGKRIPLHHGDRRIIQAAHTGQPRHGLPFVETVAKVVHTHAQVKIWQLHDRQRQPKQTENVLEASHRRTLQLTMMARGERLAKEPRPGRDVKQDLATPHHDQCADPAGRLF
eukprot:6016272-Prymnesium_polylepis.2